MCQKWLLIAVLAGGISFANAQSSFAQVRYEPSRPTVSPYLNLFRPNNGVVPNYQSLVRPLQQQYQLNQSQQLFNRQQAQSVQQLQTNLQDLQQRQAGAPTVTPTGKSGWFTRPSSRHQFMNTSRFYSQSGGAAAR